MCDFCTAYGLDGCDLAFRSENPNAPANALGPAGANVNSFKANFGGEQANTLALVQGLKWAGNTVSFSFTDQASDYGANPAAYGSGEPANGFAEFNAAQKTAARAALAEISKFTKLNFVEMASDQGNADMRFAGSTTPSTAWAYYPTGGDVWVNSASSWYTNPRMGTYAWHTIFHEIGHAVGLKHGHEATGHGALASEVDQMPYSIMTYRSYEGAAGTAYTNETYGYAQGFMKYDIAALQAIYGVNHEHNPGNNTYTFSPQTGEMFIDGVGQGRPASNRIFDTIWDGKGTDTIDVSNYSNDVTANIGSGGQMSFSNLQKAQLGAGIWADANVYFAEIPDNKKRALIDNVITGSGNDTIDGNNFFNTIQSGGGNDRIHGYAANDTLDGGDGNDLIYGGGGNDSLTGGAGKDNIIGGAGDDFIFGGTGRDKLKGNAGADVFFMDATSDKDVIRDFELGVDKVDVANPGLATLTVSNTGHLTVEYQGAWMVLRGLNSGDALVGDLVI